MTQKQQTNEHGATLPQTEGEEVAMAQFSRECPECAKPNNAHKGTVLTFELTPNIDLRGIAICRFHPDTRIPVSFIGGFLDSTSPTLPVDESSRLVGVPEGIKQDIHEAEEAISTAPTRLQQSCVDVLSNLHMNICWKTI